MLNNIETLSYIVSNLFRVYVMYLFTKAYFKEKQMIKSVYIVCAFFGYFLINTTGYLISSNIFVNLITNILPFFILTFLFQSSILRKVVAVFVSYAASMCIDAFLVSIEYILNKKFLIISSGIATSLLIFLVEKVFEYFTDKNNIYPELKKKQMLLILFVPLGSILLASQTMVERNFNYIIESVILLGINAIVFYMYDSLLKAGNEKSKLAVLEEQNISYAGQLKIYQESVQKEKIIRHDIKNHLFKIKEYASEEKILELKAYTEAMIESVENESTMCNTGNQEIDSILNFKCSKLKQLETELHFDLNIPDKINVESFDLTKILGNLLDNVSDAIVKTDKKIVYIRIHYEKGVVNICIRNTFNGQIAVNNGILQTIKPNSQNHGLGFKSIKEAVEKYNGDIDYQYDDNVFSVYIILYEK